MAEWENRFPENVPGRYYVDSECIECGLCAEIAPSNFSTNVEMGYDYVSKQPRNLDEEHRCLEALESCPVEAIGQDGLTVPTEPLPAATPTLTSSHPYS